MNSSKTILITGACGFVGKHLTNYLLDKDIFDKIVVCCRDGKAAQRLFKSQQRLIFSHSNLNNPSSYLNIFKAHTPTHIIHLAAIARFKQGEEDPLATINTNFFGTIKLIKIARQYGTKRFLVASSNLARNPKGVTGVSKYLTEAYIKTLNPLPETFSIRLPNVMDSPGAVTLLFKNQIEKGLPITITDKRMSRKFVTPHQAAKDLLFVLNTGHHTDVFINNKPSTPIVELAEKMIIQSGKDIPIQFIGKRPGEKLEEEDYSGDTIVPTSENSLFRLIENQHTPENILKAISLLKGKAPEETINKIKAVLNIK